MLRERSIWNLAVSSSRAAISSERESRWRGGQALAALTVLER
jgi:hypothetical protein